MEDAPSTDPRAPPNPPAAAVPRAPISLRVALAVLCAAMFVPLLVFGTTLLSVQWAQERELAFVRLTDQARLLRVAVEREIALDMAVLDTLASLPEFDRQDWPALHGTASAAARNRAGSWLDVVDREKRYLNTLVPMGAPLAPFRPAEAQPVDVDWNGRKIPFNGARLVADVLQTGKPSFSGLTWGPVAKAPVLALTVPVVRDGAPRYALTRVYRPEVYTKLLESVSASDGLLRVLLDQNGLVIARSRGGDDFVGRRSSPPFDKGMRDLPPEGSGELVSLEGVPVFYAYSRADPHGWAVGVAMPRDAVLAPARRAQGAWIAALLAAGLVGTLAAVGLWRRLALPLTGIAEQVRMPDGRPLPVRPSGIAEIEALRQSLVVAMQDREIRRRAELARERAEARFRLVVEASPTGKLMVDRAGVITLVNRRVEALFGHPREQLLGQHVDLLLPLASRRDHRAHMAGYFDHPVARAMGAGRELCGRRADGSEVPVEISLVPVDTDDGPFVLASIIDISERKQAQDELRRSNQDLEQFAYIASHDLQEPLRMVANYTELLGQRYRGQLDEKADKYIHYAVDGARRMQGLISDLLDFSRVGARGQALAPVATSAVVATVLQTLRQTIAASGARVDLGDLPVVWGDAGQLTRVFQNLISNALKFRGEQAPHIVVGAEWSEGRWLFSVRDNGIGFQPEFAERIFLMFQRLHERGRFEGSGIGLAIVKRIVERHGGRVWAESQPGAGTTIRFTLRAAPDTPADGLGARP